MLNRLPEYYHNPSKGNEGLGPCVSFVAPWLPGSDPKVCARCRTKHRFVINGVIQPEGEH